MPRTLLMSPHRVRRTLSRLAYEIIERNRGAETLEIAGVRSRGTALAQRLADEIGKIEGRTLQVSQIDVTPYRDDIEGSQKPADRSAGTATFTDRDVILVDDVLFTGRTARAALDAIVERGRPRSIQFVVLIDRGYREYPIQPDYTGKLIQTKYGERVVVDIDEDVSVYLEE